MLVLMTLDFKNKKVLMLGLGLQGGGVATVNWLIKQGANVTVTDLKTAEQLVPSLRQISGKVKLALGGHQEQDILDNDIVVLNPDIPPTNRFVQLAHQSGKIITNEVLIFYNLFPGKIIGLTGTRGKTTTTHWTDHFLKTKFRSTIAGNSTTHPFLKILDEAQNYDIAVAETPSFQLEYFGADNRPPTIAVVTNLYTDHLNFHGTRAQYAAAKSNLFRYQTPDQHAILNYDNDWTKQFLAGLPRSQVWLCSATQPLSAEYNGVFYQAGDIHYQSAGKTGKVLTVSDFVAQRGQHNLENLLASALAARLAGVEWSDIQPRIATLPEIEFRQQVVYRDARLTIINDTTATSPEGGMAAIRRFTGLHTILITGGTDRQLNYTEWAKAVKANLNLENVIFLSGSATNKMLAALQLEKPPRLYDTLAECLTAARRLAGQFSPAVLVFSPAAKSFEKFQNEFDRGHIFNELVRQIKRPQAGSLV